MQFVCVIYCLYAFIVRIGPMCSAHERWLILPLHARKIRRHVVPTLWCWCRAFGWKEAATWDRPKVAIDLGVMFGLCDRMTASQRERSLEDGRYVHSFCFNAAIEPASP